MIARPLAFCLVIVSLAVTEVAFACTCAAPATTEKAFQQSSAVFHGRVKQISRPFLDRIGITDSGLYHVRFDVIKSWKAAGSGEVVVKTRLSGEACGYPFETGQDYLVYVAEIFGGIETGICTGTKKIAGANSELEELDVLLEQFGDQ